MNDKIKYWYYYVESKGVFVRISPSDICSDEIVCCKTADSHNYMEGSSSIFVVTKAMTEEDPTMKFRPLLEVVGEITNIRDEHGIYIRPCKLEKYVKENGELNDDEVDAHWYEIGYNDIAKTWYNAVTGSMSTILQRRISE